MEFRPLSQQQVFRPAEEPTMKEYKEHRDKFFQKGNVMVGSIRLIGSGDIHLKDIHDKVDCLQRSQVYLHNHIGKIENDIGELKGLILGRLTGRGSNRVASRLMHADHFTNGGPKEIKVFWS